MHIYCLQTTGDDQAGLGPKYSVLQYFGTRVPILQYSSVLSTHIFVLVLVLVLEYF